MPITPPPRISVVIPIYGNVGDLDKLIAALNGQTLKPHEIIIVDSSPKELPNPPKGENVRYVRNPNDVALSWDYNLGAQSASGDLLLNMQQDCLPEDPEALEKEVACLTPERVAVVPLVTLPEANWRQYNFWGQVMMARWVGRVRQGICGKFDLIRRDVFNRIGGYDTTRFSFAGEDMDLYLRLSEQGEVFVSDVEIMHYHSQRRPLTFRAMLTKHYQLSESFGALFRRWGFKLRRIPYSSHWTHHLAKYLYLLLLLIPVAPGPVVVVLLVLTQFTHVESWRVGGWKLPILLLVNPVLFLTGFWGTIVGFLTGKQRYSQNK